MTDLFPTTCEVCQTTSALTPIEKAHLVARRELRDLDDNPSILRAQVLACSRAVVPLCRLCHMTFDRALGVVPGGFAPPYTFWWARHKRAFLRLRDERDALMDALSS